MAESRGNRTRRSSGWMWAFFILLGLLIAAGLWVVMRLQPTEQNQSPQTDQQEIVGEDNLTFEVMTDKDQLNRLINVYLENEMDEQFSGYTFTIDENVELAGALQVFGFDVDFTLLMEPYVMEDGNLQLRAESIQLGTFELPIGIAMNVLSQQLELPYWVRIDSEQQFVLIALNEFQLENDVQFSMEKIDLIEDDIRVNIILPEESVR